EDHMRLHFFPTRRSSDLAGMDGFVSKPFNIDVLVSEMMRAIAETRNIGEGPRPIVEAGGGENDDEEEPSLLAQRALNGMLDELEDRKSTRLNSSHVKISY